MNRKYAGVILLIALALPLMAACATQSGVRELDDATLEASVRANIATVSSSDATGIGVSVDKGVVTLTGSVGSAEDRRLIGDEVRKVKGVRSVINNLTVR